MSTTNISGDFQTGNVGGSNNLTPSATANANPNTPATGSAASAGSTGESDNAVAGLVKQYREAIAQGRAAFNNTGGYDYNQQFQVGLLNLFTNPAYQPYLALLGDALVQELVGEVYEILVTSSLRLAYQFPAQFGLTQPQVQRRLAQVAEDDPYQTLARIRALIAAAFSDGEEGARVGKLVTKAGQEPPLSPARPARWTRSMIAALVNQPVDSTLYLGQHNLRQDYNRPTVAPANHKLVLALIKLLGRHGAMTNFQLRTWLAADYFTEAKASPTTLRIRLYEALYLARFAGATAAAELNNNSATNTGIKSANAFATDATATPPANLPQAQPYKPEPGRVLVSDRDTVGWNGAGRPAKLWGLEDGGKLWYTMLTGSSDVPGANSLSMENSVLTPHTYGVQQTLAAFHAVVNLDNRLGLLPRIVAALELGRSELLPTTIPPVGAVGSGRITGADAGAGAVGQPPQPHHGYNGGEYGELVERRSSRRFRLEMEPWATSFPLSMARPGATATASQTRLIPDAVGRILVDSARSESYLLEEANLDPQLAINQFWQPGGSGSSNNNTWPQAGAGNEEDSAVTGAGRGGADELVWPFFLEYDRGTETPSIFAEEKYKKYAELFNSIASSAWLPRWGTKFPVVLVVTEGSASDLYRLSRAVVSQVRANTHQKAFAYWWFTTTAWLSAAYRPYLDETLAEKWDRYLFAATKRSSSKRNSSTTTTTDQADVKGVDQPGVGHDARIWLPIGALADNLEIEEVDDYFKGTDPYAARPALMLKMSALPLPHPLNARPR